ncbi:MAG TPA: OmpA family protein [Cyclobacteriaceae bacterium]|nr:OmpA family protein [Cyclobacteriaceae bacterium]
MHSIRRILIFSTVSFVLSIPVLAQEQDKEQSKAYMEQAQLMMDAGSIALEEIRDVMIQAAEFDTTAIKANFEAGHLFLQTINQEQATKYFMRVYRQAPKYRFDLEYWIGQSYQYGKGFDRAIDFYTRYKTKASKGTPPDNSMSVEETDRRITECGNGKEFMASPGNFSIVNIGKEVNSEYEDYAPVLNEDETQLVFTTRRKDGNMNENVFSDNKPWEDIFITTKTGNKWNPAKNIGAPVTTATHESTLALSKDGNTLLIYRDDGGGDIFQSTRKPDGSWSPLEPLQAVNSTYSESSASLSADGNSLYFASDRPGGLGGLDIYVTTKDSRGQWTRIRNLGPGINTAWDEEGPFIDYEGKTLYFSSKGRKTMGGYDIFKSTLTDAATNKWSEPENLGYPINSPDNDVFYVSTKDGRRGYYSSVRGDGFGYSDIYRIQLPDDPKPETDSAVAGEKKKIPLKFSVRVFDATSKAPLDAKVSLTLVKDNVVVDMVNTRPGAYDFTISDEEPRSYRLSIEKDGYVFQNTPVNLSGASEQAKTMTRTVELKKPVVGVTQVLHNIYFDFNKATFKQESFAELTKLETMMKQNGNMKLEIAGHTDSFGPDGYNKKLSQDRASAVRTFLTSKGIDTGRVTAAGYGDSRPLASNDDETGGREINRRVEFKIIGN